jgi:hypothetical protein
MTPVPTPSQPTAVTPEAAKAQLAQIAKVEVREPFEQVRLLYGEYMLARAAVLPPKQAVGYLAATRDTLDWLTRDELQIAAATARAEAANRALISGPMLSTHRRNTAANPAT